jgi:predicted ATPase/DNA-binding SARP family transcriptional activator
MSPTHTSAGDPGGLRLQVALFGTPTITWGGQVVSIPRRQSRALLYRLAAAARPLPRDQLCFMLWPDCSQSEARRSLSVVVSQLRKGLPAPDLLITPNDAIGLREDGVVVDTASFSALVPAATGAGQLEGLAAAARIYRGPFLDGFTLPDAPEFEAWVDQERQTWERRYLNTLATLVAGYRAEGAFPEAIAAAQTALATDPLAEELHCSLIELYAAQGDRSAALRQFEHCVAVLERELGVEPLLETRAVYEAVRAGQYAVPAQAQRMRAAGQASDTSAEHTQASVPAPARPPAPLGPLIGRDAELEALRALLADPEVRMITLVGPGGSGKTRLALELVRQHEPELLSDVLFVPLAPLRDPALVLGAIAQACGVTGAGAPSLDVALRAAFAGRRALLVLDNFEQLVPAAPALAELLWALPELRLLITSRCMLYLSGERIFPVAPLPLPTLSPLPALDELAAQPAVALLVARTRALNPQFALTMENAADLAAICVRLDGLPLALELAAARLRLMPAHTLLRRLDHRLALLTHGPQDLPERQRALRTVIAWSEGLLDSAARALFATTAVFAGSWAIDAAENLGRSSGHPALKSGHAVLDALTALVDASLVQQVVGATGEPRLQLLETIREYAWAQLQEQGVATRAADAHLQFYAEHATAAATHLRSIDAGYWFNRVEEDEPNLCAALEHAGMRSEPDATLRLLEALVPFWAVRGHLHEGRAWIERALRPLAQIQSQEDVDSRDLDLRKRLARVCLRAADLFFIQGEYAASIMYLEVSILHFRALGQTAQLVIGLSTLAGAYSLVGDYATAVTLIGEVEALATTVDDAEAQAWLALDYGRAARHRGQPREALGRLTEAARHYRSQGDLWVLATVFLDLAPVLLALGDEDAAEVHAAEALSLARQLKSQALIANALNELGEIARYRGRDEEAEGFYTESMQLLRRMGNRSEEPRLRHNLAQLSLRRGDLQGAAARFAESLAVFAERQIERGVMESLIGLAAVATAHGRPLEAAQLWGAAAELAATEGWELWPPDQLAYAQAVAQARRASDPAAFDVAWQQGRGLTITAACALANDVARWRPAEL